MEKNKYYARGKKISDEIIDIMQGGHTHPDEELTGWLAENDHSQEVIRTLSDGESLRESLSAFAAANPEESLKNLYGRLTRRSRRRSLSYIAGICGVAACLVVAIIATFDRPSPYIVAPVISALDADVPTLITPDGNVVRLEESNPGTLAQTLHDGASYHSGTLSAGRGSHVRADDLIDQVNIVIVPRRAMLRVLLPDSTLVVLNGGSTLQYPSVFGPDERRVELSGEGWFEIAGTGCPFVVRASEVEVRAYGTEFNLNAYREERIETVLVKGSVGVKTLSGETIISPGQMSVTNSLTGESSVEDVGTASYRAWTGGFWRYDNDTLDRMIRDISQWYGVPFTFADAPTGNIRLSASVSRELELHQVLELVEITINVEFEKKEGGYRIRETKNE